MYYLLYCIAIIMIVNGCHYDTCIYTVFFGTMEISCINFARPSLYHNVNRRTDENTRWQI